MGLALAWQCIPRLARDTSLEQLFPEASAARQSFADFDAAFGTDDALLVVVRDTSPEPVFNARYLGFLDRVVDALEADPAVQKVVALTNLLDFTVVDPRLPPLPHPLIPARRGAAKPELRSRIEADPLLGNGLLSTDGTASACWVLLRPELRSRADYLQTVEALAAGLPTPGAEAPDLEILATGFPLLQGAALELMARDAIVLALGALTALLAVALLGRVPWRAAMGFLLSWPAVIGALAAWAYATGRPLHVFSNSVPPLLLITSGATFVHLGHALGRGRAALRPTLTACALATGTTAVGFGSLAFSQLAPLAALGLEVAVGSALAFVLGTACILSLTPVRDAATRDHLSSRTGRTGRTGRASRHRGRALLVAVVALGTPWFAFDSGRLTELGDVLRLLPNDHPRVLDAERARELFGAPTPFEVVLVAKHAQIEDPEFLLQLEDFETALIEAGGQHLPFVLSPVTLLRALELRLASGGASGGANATRIRRQTAEYAIQQLIRPYIEFFRHRTDPAAGGAANAFTDWMRHLMSTEGDRLRFGCRIPHLSPDAVRALVTRLEERVFRPFEASLGVERIYATGYAVLVSEAAAEVRATQARSLVGGGAVLALLLLLVLRSPLQWALAVATNALTVGSVLSFLWLVSASLHLYSGVLMAALLGVLVDDTVHLLWFVRQARDQPDPVDAALRQVAPSIVLSSVCLGAGFAVFALSSLPIYRQFAWTAAAAIALALFWDVAALPRALSRVIARR